MAKAFTQLRWMQLLRQGKSIYAFAELLRLSGLSPPTLRRALHRLTKRGLLLKLSKGYYANGFVCPTLEEVAGRLYLPSYISLESALFMHGVSEQAPHLITCVTLNKTKTFHTALGEIAYVHLKSDLFFGYQVQDRILLADPEKAVLDFVYLQRKRGLALPLDEWNWEHVPLDRMRSNLTAYPETVRRHVEYYLSHDARDRLASLGRGWPA